MESLLLLMVENWLGSGTRAVIFVLPLSAWEQEEDKHGYPSGLLRHYCWGIIWIMTGFSAAALTISFLQIERCSQRYINVFSACQMVNHASIRILACIVSYVSISLIFIPACKVICNKSLSQVLFTRASHFFNKNVVLESQDKTTY